MKANVCFIISCFCLCFCRDGNGLRTPGGHEFIDEFVRDDYVSEKHSLNRETREILGASELSIDLLNDTFDSKLSSVFHLNDTHDQLLVHWAGKGSPVLVCLTKSRFAKRNATENATSNIYFSYDYGNTYIKKPLPKIGNKDPLIDKFYRSLVDNNRYVFADITNNYLFVTKDAGNSIDSISLNFRPDTLLLHETSLDLILASEKNDTHGNLWFSDDFGKHWLIVQSDIKSYFWGNNNDNESTVFVQKCPNNICILKSFSHKFKKNEKDWMREIIDFQVNGKYLFVTKFASWCVSEHSTCPLDLWVSYERKAFRKASFPFTSSMKAVNYNIVDCEDDQVMVGVTFNDSNTNLYVSNVKGTRFTLSLSHVVYLNSSLKTSPKLDEGAVDIHKIEGLTAIYIINRWKSHPQDGNKSVEKIESVISFNRGGIWKPLRAPLVDSKGHPTKCDINKNCSLHLTQKYKEFTTPSKRSQTMSKASAVGIVYSSGNLGNSLKSKTNIYLSTDGGLNWKESLTGSYTLSFGDFGAIIVAVNNSAKSSGVNILEYSFDTGNTWKQLKFLKNDEKIKVYGLMTEPGETTGTFTLFGSTANSLRHEWILVKINFTSIFERKCNETDYEEWSPQGPMHGCFLGRKEIVKRKNPLTKCLNNIDYMSPVSKENCSCAYDDFECEFGFIRSEFDERKCIRDKSLQSFDLIPEVCKPGGSYLRTRGYMKITGDTCEGGISSELEPVVVQCLPTAEESGFLVFVKKLQSSHIPLTLVILMLIVVLGLMVARHRRLRRSFLSFVNSHYDTRSDSATILVTDDGLGE
ncbi:sortilin-related receptor-like protein [Leptotrombidium deliense]|uniref:Sortilin-related receptor-like protein n=1 Tax=Leptotrombidium deliense TaxID=299467 RepID=A0A443SNE4_9ACAR|nr:sortilin-related receptor-like protein [Leptotrombidium deliense]